MGNSGAPPVAPPYRQGVNIMDYGADGTGTVDSSAALLAAITRAAALGAASGGIVYVILPAGYKFLIKQVRVSAGNWGIWAYGATVVPQTAAMDNNGMIYLPGSNPGVYGPIHLCGGTWLGTGAEVSNQNLFNCGSNVGLVDVVCRDMTVKGWGCGPLFFRNPSRLHILNNRILTCGAADGVARQNQVNVVYDGGQAVTGEAIITGNFVDQAYYDAIALVVTALAAGSFDLRALIANNVCTGVPAGGGFNSGCIAVELDAATTQGRVAIVNNDVTAYPNTVNNGAVQVGVGGAQTGTAQKILVAGNRISSAFTGLLIRGAAPDVSAVDNAIAGAPAISGTPTYQRGNRFSANPSQGAGTLVAGTVSIANTDALVGDRINAYYTSAGGAQGSLRATCAVAGTVVITSSSGTDTSNVAFEIIH